MGIHKVKAVWPLLYSSLFIVFAIEVLSGWKGLVRAEGVLALLCFAASLPAARSMFRWISCLFLGAGILCLLWTGQGFGVFMDHMASNVVLFALLFVLPFINRVIRVGGYDKHLSRWLNASSGSTSKLFFRSTVVSYVLSLFLFLAAIPLVHGVLSKHLHGLGPEARNRFMSRSILRGYGMVAVWSPVEPLVAMAAGLTGASYLSLLPPLLGVSLFLLAAGAVWGRLQIGRLPLPPSSHPQGPPPSKRKFGMLFAGLALLIALASWMQASTGMTFFEALTLIIVPFSALWALAMGRLRRFAAATRIEWTRELGTLPNMLVLFLAFGFFNQAVAGTPLLEMVSAPLQAVAAQPVMLYLSIFAACIVFPMAGIHPFITMGLFGVMLQPLLGTLNPVSVAVVLITCCITSCLIGAFSTSLALMSGQIGVNPYRITGWNIGFALFFGLAGVGMGLLLL